MAGGADSKADVAGGLARGLGHLVIIRLRYLRLAKFASLQTAATDQAKQRELQGLWIFITISRCSRRFEQWALSA